VTGHRASEAVLHAAGWALVVLATGGILGHTSASDGPAVLAAAALDDRLEREHTLRRQLIDARRDLVERSIAGLSTTSDPRGTERERLALALLEIDLAQALARRSGGEALRSLDAATSARTALLEAMTDDPRRPLLAADQAEALLLTRPVLDGSESFLLVGLPSDAEREELVRDFARGTAALGMAERPVVGDTAAALALDRTREARIRPLPAIAAARALVLGLDPPGASPIVDRPVERLGVSEALAFATLLEASDRATAAACRKRVSDGGDATALQRTAATVAAILSDERHDPVATIDRLRRLAQGLARAEGASRLLVADATVRAGPDRDPEPWFRLFDQADDAALRGALLERVRRSTSAPDSSDLGSAAPLVVVAFADSLPRPATIEALMAAVDGTIASPPVRRVALYELARLLALERRYAEAAERFRSFAARYGDDPLSVEALDLALEIGESLDDPAGLAATLRLGIDRFRDHPRRFTFRLRAGEVALLQGDTVEALTRFAEVPSAAAEWPSAVLGTIEAHLRTAENAAQLRDQVAALDAAVGAERSLDGRSLGGAAQRRLRGLVAWHRLLAAGASGADEAERQSRSLLADEAADLRVRGIALDVALRAAEALDRPIELGDGGLLLLAQAPDVALPPIRRRLEAGLAETERLTASGDSAAARALAGRRLTSLAMALRDRAGSRLDGADRRLVASALAASGPTADAVAAIRDALADEPGSAPLRLALADTLRTSSGGIEEALGLYREVARDAAAGSELWWAAQIGELEVLAGPSGGSDATDRSRADALVARINRLKRDHPDLGSPASRAAIESLLRRLRGT
jgi:TolA-binding protein